MVKDLNRSLTVALCLLLAFCASVFIGQETLISIVAILFLLTELGISYFLLKIRTALHWIYMGTVAVEVLFLVTGSFWALAVSIVLLLASGIWNELLRGMGRKRARFVLVVRKALFSLAVLIVSVLWVITLYTQPIVKSIELPADSKPEIETTKLDPPEAMLKNVETMNAFGSRTTGSKGHNQYIAWLEQQLADLGLTIYRDHYTFDRWEEKKSSIIIDNQQIHVSSAYPYSGETGANGVAGELVFTKRGDYDKAKDKIAVVEVKNLKHFPIGLVMNVRKAFPARGKIPSNEGDLVLTTGLKEAHLDEAKAMGVKAVILVWEGVSDEKVEQQYLPFTTEYAGIPAVWINGTDGQKVIRAAKKHQEGTVILEADLQKDAPTESFYVKIEGRNKKETIIVNTHTDGVNVVEENGAIGMLSMIRYLQQEQPERTMVFAFVTGHFRLPDFKGTSQAMSTWMEAHPELWDGGRGHMKAVAGITVEHLGSLEWKDDASGHYGPTGQMSTEFTYAGNAMMEAIWLKAVEHRNTTRTVILRGHNKLEFGESQPLFEAGIPVIGFIPMPDYLTVNSENREMDKFDSDLMHAQVESLLKAVNLIDRTPTRKLGKVDRYSFFYGRTR